MDVDAAARRNSQELFFQYVRASNGDQKIGRPLLQCISKFRLIRIIDMLIRNAIGMSKLGDGIKRSR